MRTQTMGAMAWGLKKAAGRRGGGREDGERQRHKRTFAPNGGGGSGHVGTV